MNTKKEVRKVISFEYTSLIKKSKIAESIENTKRTRE